MVINELFKELELLLSDIAFAGLHNIQPVTVQKLEELKHWMNELNMTEGVRLIDRFIESVHDCRAGKMTVAEVATNLCALEFYEKTISGNL